MGAFASGGSLRICYSTDGTDPACAADGTSCTSGTDQTTTAVPAVTADITYEVIGCLDSSDGDKNSDVATFAYTVNNDAGVVQGTAAGAMKHGTTPTAFTSTNSLRICYSTDGTDPACAADGLSCSSGTDQATTAVTAVTA